MHKQSLNGSWRLRPAKPSEARVGEFPITATVPGCVHTDLLRAKLIPDPYASRNEYELRWIGETDWIYEMTFVADRELFALERVDLVAEGLDTVATITLNGEEVARTQNMHRTYRFDVKRLLKEGENALVIKFVSPVRYAEEMRQRLGSRPYVNGPAGPFNFIRKMACNFGWDWGPALPTCGIWKSVRLEGWTGVRISGVQHQLENRLLNFRIHLEWGEDRDYIHEEWQITSDRMLYTDNFRFGDPVVSAALELEEDKLALWWPRGHGAQPLQEWNLKINCYAEKNGPSDTWSGRISLRTVELDASPDDIGRKFVVKVNGKPIFCKGFNWIPDDCFLDRANEPGRLRERLQQAVDAGGNMIRVWGGGIFETDEFYNICDELGIMVWQDFLFACAMYPEEEPLKSEVEAEVRDNVARLSAHPSLIIWNGCNENIWAYKNWGWDKHEDVVGKTWGRGYYLDLIPRVLKELDPSRPYWAASPWSGDPDIDNGLAPNLSTHGNKHVWEAWFQQDYGAYRQFAPRFCSEFGFQGPATYSSIARMVPEDERDFGSEAMRHRQKSGNPSQDDGDRRNLRHLIQHFNVPGAAELLQALAPPDPDAKAPACGSAPLHAAKEKSKASFDDLHYLLSMNQCRALALGVEWFRSRQPDCMGTLYWQLNDCWPGGTTWSCIDGDGHKKPLWYATRRFYAPRLLTIQPEGDALVLYANNDSDAPWRQEVRINRLDFGGIVKGVITREIDVPPRTNARVGVLPTAVAQPDDRAREFIVADASTDARATWFFLADKELWYPAAEFDAELEQSGDQYRLTISAQTLMRDCLLQVDRIDADATVQDNLLTILPGEDATFVICSKLELKKEELIQAPVLMCVNRFGRQG